MIRRDEHDKGMGGVPLVIRMSVAFWLLEARPAWAYLDPGTGSYLFQMAIAGLLGAVFTFRTQVKRLVAKIRDKFSTKQK